MRPRRKPSRPSPAADRRGPLPGLLLLAGLTAAAAAPAADPAHAFTRPFQPGIRLDWSGRAVWLDARVVLRDGPLEFLACFPGKEHESVLRLAATPAHVVQALGLVGHAPGHPASWHPDTGAWRPPAGDLLAVELHWSDAGHPRAAEPRDWLRQTEDNRAPLPLLWRFAGSRLTADGTLVAGLTGSGIALVDMDDAVLCPPLPHSRDDAALWLTCGPGIPPEGTPVRLRVGPPPRRPPRFALDATGLTLIDGRPSGPGTFVGWLGLALEKSDGPVRVTLAPQTLAADERRLRARCAAAGLPLPRIELLRQQPSDVLE